MKTLLFVIIFLLVISISLLIYIIKLISNEVPILLYKQSENHDNILKALLEMRLFLQNYFDALKANIFNEMHVEHSDISNKIDENMQAVITQFEQTIASLSNIESQNIEINNLILKRFGDIDKIMKEHGEIANKLLLSTTSRDMLSKEYLKELSERTDSLKKTTVMIYKDYDLLLELLKAGLMNDLIKDLKEKAINNKHLS